MQYRIMLSMHTQNKTICNKTFYNFRFYKIQSQIIWGIYILTAIAAKFKISAEVAFIGSICTALLRPHNIGPIVLA